MKSLNEMKTRVATVAAGALALGGQAAADVVNCTADFNNEGFCKISQLGEDLMEMQDILIGLVVLGVIILVVKKFGGGIGGVFSSIGKSIGGK